MSTDHDFKTHPSSQKMKCLVGDYLNSKSGQLLFDNSSFLVFLSQSRHADIHIINRQFTAIAQSTRIKQLSSLSCCTYLQRDRHFIFIYATKKQVIVLKYQQTNDGFEASSQVCRAQYAFEANDGFKVLSKPFKVNQSEFMLAYSEKDEFYLVSLQLRGIKTILEVTKLIDQDKSNNIWSWFTRQKNPHYEKVKIMPIQCVDVYGYQFISLRDNTAVVFYISLKQQVEKSTIKQMYACSSLPATINIESELLSAQLISQKMALIAYYFNKKVTLVKLSIIDNEHTLTLQKVNLNIFKENFQILQCKQHIYFNFKDNRTSNYKCIKFEADLQQLENQFNRNQPLFESHNPIWLCGNNKELFLINSYNIYQIEQDKDDSGLPQQIKKYQSFEAWLERTFNKKIKKQTQLRNYFEIQDLLEEKQSKLIEQMNHLKKGGLQESVQAKISQKIICTFIVKSIISKKDYFATFLRNIEHPNIQIEENFLQNFFINQSPEEIQGILRIIEKMQMFEYINEILEDVKVHPQRETCSNIINSLFSDVCSNAIHSFKTNNKNRNISVHKILMEYTFNFIQVEQESFIDDFLFLANEWKSDESQFVHNLVLNAKLTKIFMHLFINSSKIIFTVEEITEIVSNLMEVARHLYLSQFFDRLKDQYKKSEKDAPKKNQLTKKCAHLVRGLTKYALQIEGILSTTFPGLLAYLYLKNPQTNQNKKQLIKIAEKCSNPATAYMLCLSAPGDSRKQWKQALAKIRLCKDLLLPYSHQEDILNDIEEGKHKQKPMINEQNWKKSVQILEIPKERAAKLAQNLIIVRL